MEKGPKFQNGVVNMDDTITNKVIMVGMLGVRLA
jgi:hypothetical protein